MVNIVRPQKQRGRSSMLGKQISSTLCAGMELPQPLELLFRWIEARECFVDTPTGRVGFLFPEDQMKQGWTEHGRPGGTKIYFEAEHDIGYRHFFRTTYT